jgi:opacity protein-like surface antigen
MKKLLLALALCLALTVPVYAIDITAEWDQEVFDGLTGWKMYMAVDSPGGPYQHFTDIPYDGSGAYTYTCERPLTLLPGEHSYSFVLVTFAGTEASANSPEATLTLKGDVPAVVRFQMTITAQ